MSVVRICLLAMLCVARLAHAQAQQSSFESWVLVDHDRNDMNGCREDLAQAKRAAAGHARAFWYKREGKSWLITDPATLDKIKASFVPLDAFTEQMNALGKKQSELGDKQAFLGDKQAALAEQEKPENAEQQRSLGKQMGELGSQMEKLGEQMRALSKKMQAAAKQVDADLVSAVKQAQDEKRVTPSP